MHTRILLPLGLLISLPTLAGEPALKTLCTTEEKVVFSCAVKRKLLSICASADLSHSSGYLQYRFGSLKRIDLAYPDKYANPHEYFRFFRANSAKSSTEQLSFKSGKFTYIVFVERAAFDWNGSGVVIKSAGQQVAYLPCDRRPIPDELDMLEELGLPAADYESFDRSIQK